MNNELKTEIIIVRHCETDINSQNCWQGDKFDLGLNENGITQAKKLNAFFKNKLRGEALCFVSPTKRATETTEIAFPEVPMTQISGLLPFRLGSADGLPTDQVRKLFGFPNPMVYGDMENLRPYINRVKKTLANIIKMSKDKIAIVVTHEDISAMFEKILMKKSLLSVPKLGIRNGEARKYEIGNMSATVLDFAKIEVKKEDLNIQSRDKCFE